MTIANHMETYKLGSRDHKDWLSMLLYRETEKAASKEAQRAALSVYCATWLTRTRPHCAPRDERDLAITAQHGRIISCDNLTHISENLSNAFCSLATGGGFATRELFTDEGEVIFDAQRPIILNGIAEAITKSDLLDRAILVYLRLAAQAYRMRKAAIMRDLVEVVFVVRGRGLWVWRGEGRRERNVCRGNGVNTPSGPRFKLCWSQGVCNDEWGNWYYCPQNYLLSENGGTCDGVDCFWW